MPKKINDTIKTTASFLYAVSQSCNNREASRYAAFFQGDDDFKTCDEKVKQVLLALAHEPVVNRTNFIVDLERDGIKRQSRSKLVMEYAKHNRMFLNIVKLRSINKSLCDNVLHSISIEEMRLSGYPRAYVLERLNERVGQ